MLGSSSSIAETNTVMNTIVADALGKMADRLEKAEDLEKEIKLLIQETVKEHKRIIFNGNNYSEEWVEEAAQRGLLNLRTTADAVPYLVENKNIALFTRRVFIVKRKCVLAVKSNWKTTAKYCTLRH